MEENDEKKTLSKEEILAQNRADNKNGDEREMQFLYKGAFFASAIGFCLSGIISLVLSFFDMESYEMNAVTFAIIGIMYTIFGVKTTKHKKLFLAAGIIGLIATAIFLTCWILQLCSVI